MQSQHYYTTGTSEESRKGGSCCSWSGSWVGSVAGSVVGGSLLGAALMYLLDPDSGSRRRHDASEGLWDAGESAARKAGRAAHRAGGATSDFGTAAAAGAAGAAGWLGRKSWNALHRAGEGASDVASGAYERASDAYGRAYSGAAGAAKSGRDWLFDRDDEDDTNAAAAVGASVGTALCWIAAGAALMYFLDPQRGNRRRAGLRDKAFRYGRETGQAVRDTTAHARNHARGWAAEARRLVTPEEPVTDEKLVARVRAEMGRHVSHVASIRVTAEGGQVVLAGPVLANEVDGLLAAVRSVRGVKGVENRLDVRDQPWNEPGLQGHSQKQTSEAPRS